jgi:hypothetical protein
MLVEVLVAEMDTHRMVDRLAVSSQRPWSLRKTVLVDPNVIWLR